MIPMRMIPNDPRMTPLWRIAHGNANDSDPMEVLAKLKKAAVVLLEWYNKLKDIIQNIYEDNTS